MKILRTTSLVCLALLLVLSIAMSQSSGDVKEQKRHVIVQGTQGASGALHIAEESHAHTLVGIKTVKGAPYSAETRSETVQTLGDGNRIVRRNNTRILRDSEGRTRQEYAFGATGEAVTGGMISIHDPVAGVAYTLHPATKTAERITFSGDPMSWTDRVDGTTALPSGHSHVFIRKVPGPEPMPQTLPHASIERDVMIRVFEPHQSKEQFTTESLGTRVMEGIQVEGKRSTSTLPAGAIGNEQPITTVTETWYSPELQTIIFSRREDPLAGTTIFQVTRLVRGEPDASLFQLPPDFTVNEANVNVIRKIEEIPVKK